MKKSALVIRALIALPIFASVGGSTLALATPSVKIVEGTLAVKGPGCPTDGSVFADILNDGSTVQFSFNDLLANASPGAAPLDQKNCIATVDVEVPAGYRVAPGPIAMEATVLGVSETGSASVYARYYLDGKASDFVSRSVSSAEFPTTGQPMSISLESGDASQNPNTWSGTCGGVHKLNLQTRAIARRGANDVSFTEVFVDRAVGNLKHGVACEIKLQPCR